MNPFHKFLLGCIYCFNLLKNDNPCSIISYIEKKTFLDKNFLKQKIYEIESLGYIIINQNGNENSNENWKDVDIQLTNFGRTRIKVVLVGGVFDLLHVGHIYTLKSAHSFGDILVVIIATNSTALKMKKNRKIYHDENSRLELVSSLRFVDIALIGREGTLYKSVEYVKPDIIALGYDQVHSELDIKKNCQSMGIAVDVVRISSPIPKIKSSLIKQELGNFFYDV